MQSAVQAFLQLPAVPEPPDVADAIAIALCASSRAAGPLPELAARRRPRRVRTNLPL